MSGLSWHEVVPGVEVQAGPVRLLVTAYVSPCEKIAGSFSDGGVSRLSQQVHPGRSRAYARVLEAGVVRAGDPVRLSRPAEVPARVDRPD